MRNFYTPVVKAKRNDLRAIVLLTDDSKESVFPLIEPPVVLNGGSLETRSVDAAVVAAETLGNLPFYFDPLDIESPERQMLAFRKLGELNANFVPTLGLARKSFDLDKLISPVSSAGGRLAIRLEILDLEDPEASWDKIAYLCTGVGVRAERVTLFLDFAQLAQRNIDELREMTLDFLTYQTAGFAGCRVVVLGSSALHTVSSVPIDGSAAVARRELLLWAGLNFELGGSRNLHFGDYGVIDPSFVFAGGPSVNANAKIRYTCGGTTTYFRGHGLYKPGRFAQYHDLTRRVASSPRFRGNTFSEGDGMIMRCANHESGPGNLASWVRADMNHHLEYTAAQVERISGQFPFIANQAELADLIEVD